MSPEIVGPATGMMIGGLGFAGYLVWSVARGTGDSIDPIAGLAVAAFVGGVLGYESVAWLGLVTR